MPVNYHVIGLDDQPQDYFSYLVNVRPVPIQWNNLAISSLEPLRRARTFRPRIYCVPDEQQNTLAGYDCLEYEVATTPGSWLWTLTVSYSSLVERDLVSIQVTDVASGVALFKYWTCIKATRAQITTPLIYLGPPKPITGQGLLTVEIANLQPTDLTSLSVNLFLAEPIIDMRTQGTGRGGQ